MNFFSAADLVASIVGASSAKRDLSSEAPEDDGPSQKKKVKLSDQDEDESKSSDEVEEVNEDDKLAIRQVFVAPNFVFQFSVLSFRVCYTTYSKALRVK